MSSLEDFTLYIKNNGYSNVYINPIKNYLNYCMCNDIDYLLITFENLNSYIEYLKDNNILKGTINNHIKSLRFFYKYLAKNGSVTVNVAKLPTQFSLTHLLYKKSDYFSKKEIDMLIDLSGTVLSIDVIKIKALFHFIMYTGISKSGLLVLKRENINLKECSAVIKTVTKQRQDKTVFFPRKVSDEIKKYFKNSIEVNNAFNIGKQTIVNVCSKLNKFVNNKHFTSYAFKHSLKKQVKGRYEETK